MSDDLRAPETIESPCIWICAVHPDARICVGCHRTLDEIAAWTRMSPEARAEVWAALPARAALLQAPQSGPGAVEPLRPGY